VLFVQKILELSRSASQEIKLKSIDWEAVPVAVAEVILARGAIVSSVIELIVLPVFPSASSSKMVTVFRPSPTLRFTLKTHEEASVPVRLDNISPLII